MRRQPDVHGLGVQDVLSNPFGGPHWLPAGYGFTPLPELHQASPSPPTSPEPPENDSPPYRGPPSYSEDDFAEEQGLSQGERDFLRENGYLKTDETTETINEYRQLPHGERFKMYIERKMRRFGRRPRQQDSSVLNTFDDMAAQSQPTQDNSALQRLADAALQGTRRIIDRSVRPQEKETPKGAQNLMDHWQEAITAPINDLEQLSTNEKDQLSHLEPSRPFHYSQVYGSNNSQITKHERNSAEWEQDLMSFIHATEPERGFQQEAERIANSGYGAASPDDHSSTELGKLFYALIDPDAESQSEMRYRTRSEFLRWSEVARRSSKPIYVATHLRSIRLLTKGKGRALVDDSEKAVVVKYGKDSTINPLLAENPFGHVPDGANGWSGGRYFDSSIMTPAMLPRFAFQNPYTSSWLTQRECQLIWAIVRRVRTAPHHGLRRVSDIYNRRLMDMIFTDIIRDQRKAWWVKAEGGYHIASGAGLDCKRILEALQETPNSKFCSLKFQVDTDPLGGYWDINANYAFGRWLEARNPTSTRFKPLELLQRAKSDPARRVELVVLGPFLDKYGRYWDRVEPKRTTFFDGLEESRGDATPRLNQRKRAVERAARRIESGVWAESRPVLELDCGADFSHSK